MRDSDVLHWSSKSHGSRSRKKQPDSRSPLKSEQVKLADIIVVSMKEALRVTSRLSFCNWKHCDVIYDTEVAGVSEFVTVS